MKSISSILVVIFLTISVYSQDVSSSDFHDNIIALNEFFILRNDSSLNKNSNIRVDEIRNIKIAEQLFGNNCNVKHYDPEYSYEGFTQIQYRDGLRIHIPDFTKGLIEFWITSSKYKLVLNNGKEFKIGMDLEALKDIYPLSYSNQRTLFPSGITVLDVEIINKTGNKIVSKGAWIVFEFNKDTKILERISTRIPD